MKRKYRFKCHGNGKTYSMISVSWKRCLQMAKEQIENHGYIEFLSSDSFAVAAHDGDFDDAGGSKEARQYRKDQYDRINKKKI